MNLKFTAVSIFSAIFLLGLNTTAFAVPCDAGGVSGSVACQDGINNNDFPAPEVVNNEEFFHYDDWVYLAKQNTPGDFESSEFYITEYAWTVDPIDPAAKNGLWSFDSSVWDYYEDVMITVKTGNTTGGKDGIFFSGYLLDNTTKPSSGTWDVGNKELSHLTLYARGPSTAPIPEPTTLLLFGSGLLGLAGFARRKRN